MDPEKQRWIASLGGRAAHRAGNAHEFDAEEARAAGRKGGSLVAKDRVYMSEIGRRGGAARGRKYRPPEPPPARPTLYKLLLVRKSLGLGTALWEKGDPIPLDQAEERCARSRGDVVAVAADVAERCAALSTLVRLAAAGGPAGMKVLRETGAAG